MTVAGKGGPAAIRTLRRSGFSAPVLFDRCGYFPTAGHIDLSRWIHEQRVAGADRTLTGGRLVTLDRAAPDRWRDDLESELTVADEVEATALIALDARLLARQTDELIATISASSVPVALVLVDRGDPLGIAGAVEGLSRTVRSSASISVLRSDHGSIAVPAFGGAHASIGLAASTRHYSRGMARAKPTRMNRVFVPHFLDWFTADLIAGWSAAASALSCSLSCCNGQRLDRFFDISIDPRAHNMNAIAAFANDVLTPDPDDRPRAFLDLVHTAHDHYDVYGLMGPTSKAQLNSWALL